MTSPTATASSARDSRASPDGFPWTVSANDLEIYVDQVGEGPDVLLIGGLGDTVESWQFQLEGLADRYRLTAFDNRGAGRTRARRPRAAEHMGGDGPLQAQVRRARSLAGRRRPQRACLSRVVLQLHYTPRAHNDGTVDQIIEEVLAFPHKQAPENTQRTLDAFVDHDTSDRLGQIAAPTLVLAGGST